MSGISLQSLLLRGLLRTISATWRYRESIPGDLAPLLSGSDPVLIAFWHGKMLPVWYRFRGRGWSALISGSRDGELLARYLSGSLGYVDVIRGSSSKGGSRAMSELVERLEERSCLITPDGPRGPARKGKAGALVAAGRSGRALIGVGWRCRRSIIFRSWDHMELPFPFSVIEFRYCNIELPTDPANERTSEPRKAGQAATPDTTMARPDLPAGERRRVEQEDLDRLDALLDRLCR